MSFKLSSDRALKVPKVPKVPKVSNDLKDTGKRVAVRADGSSPEYRSQQYIMISRRDNLSVAGG